MKDRETLPLFEEYAQEDWEKEWQDMPEFVQPNIMPYRTINIHFNNKNDVKKFAELLEQTITIDTKYLWFPKPIIGGYTNKRYDDES
jgi:hypothetical protein